MKFQRLLLVISLMGLSHVKAQYLKLGDNIYDYFKANIPKFSSAPKKINAWNEGELSIYSYSMSQDTTRPYILLSADGKFVFGAIQGQGTNAYYLFDTDGDKKLDFKTDNCFIPYWIIGEHAKLSGNAEPIDSLLNLMFQAFETNEGPANVKMKTGVLAMMKYYNDTTLENRDIVYLLDLYIQNTKHKDIALYAITQLETVYQQRFKKTHPIFYLYQGETFEEKGDIESAKECFRKLYLTNPDYLPALYYMCKLDVDGQGKYRSELKEKYPAHWQIKTL